MKSLTTRMGAILIAAAMTLSSLSASICGSFGNHCEDHGFGVVNGADDASHCEHCVFQPLNPWNRGATVLTRKLSKPSDGLVNGKNPFLQLSHRGHARGRWTRSPLRSTEDRCLRYSRFLL